MILEEVVAGGLYSVFKGLHESPYLFVLPNAWNAKSAELLQEKNAPALATSSAAVADGPGYKDGEGMPFANYLFVIRRIVSSVQIPVLVDMEMDMPILLRESMRICGN